MVIRIAGLLTAFVVLAGDDAQAQLIQVQPGYVKAPFVRVYTYPDGGSYVRAPFVGIHTPGHVHYGYSGQPRQTDEWRDEIAEHDWPELAAAVREWAGRLDEDLSRYPSGEFWKSRLHPAEILELVSADAAGPPSEDVRGRLQAILETFNEIGRAPEVNRVASLQSFRRLHAALAEYSTPAEWRLRHRLYSSASVLHRRLQRFDTGATWQRHFGLTQGGALSEERANASDNGASPGDLAAVLARFDAVSRNEDFAVIAQLPEFKRTHDRLAAYVHHLDDPSARPEELPPPAPQPPEV